MGHKTDDSNGEGWLDGLGTFQMGFHRSLAVVGKYETGSGLLPSGSKVAGENGGEFFPAR